MSVVGSAISALGSIGSGLISSNASSKAADSSLALQSKMFDTTQANEQPFINAGQTAEGQLSAGTQAGGEFNSPYTMADFQQDPGYAFDLQQGNQAVQRSAAAQGTLNSGGTLKAISNYTQGMASNEFSNAYNRYMTTRQDNYNNLAGIAGTGVAATGALGGAASQYGTNAGATSAAGITGSGNALASGLSGATNAAANNLNLSSLLGQVSGNSSSFGSLGSLASAGSGSSGGILGSLGSLFSSGGGAAAADTGSGLAADFASAAPDLALVAA